MISLVIDLKVTFESALSVGAGGSAGTIADKSIVRDGWGRPLIPGSQLKGKLRWAVEQLLRAMGDDIAAPFEDPPDILEKLKEKKPIQRNQIAHWLFGTRDHRSPLQFADLHATAVSPALAHTMRQELSQIRPSVSINRRRGVAEDARLLFQETALEGMQFAHERAITGNLPDEKAKQYAALLWAALKFTDRWGGAKSRGLGWGNIEVMLTLGGEQLAEAELADALRAVLTQGGSQ